MFKLRSRLVEGQGEREGGASARPVAGRPDLATVGLDEGLADRQADAVAADGARARPIYPVETLEEVRQVLRGDTHARVADLDGQGARLRAGPHAHLAACG